MDRESFDPDRIKVFRHEGDASIAPEVEELVRQVIGAAIEVHRALGPGFGEPVYQAALAIELESRGIRAEREAPVEVAYKGQCVGKGRMDLLVRDVVVVETKVVDALAPVHKAQLVSYLKAKDLPIGLLMNFNVPVMKDGIKRVIL